MIPSKFEWIKAVSALAHTERERASHVIVVNVAVVRHGRRSGARSSGTRVSGWTNGSLVGRSRRRRWRDVATHHIKTVGGPRIKKKQRKKKRDVNVGNGGGKKTYAKQYRNRGRRGRPTSWSSCRRRFSASIKNPTAAEIRSTSQPSVWNRCRRRRRRVLSSLILLSSLIVWNSPRTPRALFSSGVYFSVFLDIYWYLVFVVVPAIPVQ